MMDSPGIIIPKIKDESEDGLKLALCANIRDGILEYDLVCDYLLYKLNKESVFNYVNRYTLPMRRPTDSIHDLSSSIMERFKLTERQSAYEALLRDFRDGKLGNITLDELPIGSKPI
jgi:ribosome biogenesis GTPase A